MLSFQELEQQINGLSSTSDEYKDSFYSKYRNYIIDSELPEQFQDDNINKELLPNHINTLYKNITEIVDNRYNIMFNFLDFEFTHNIAAMLIEKYFIDKGMSDDRISTVVYVDTNLLMEDYKRMMNDPSKDDYTKPVHHLKTLTQNIECADFVIWDKSNMLKSSYERDKFYDILSIRYRYGLGNLFFTKGYTDALKQTFNRETFIVMDLSTVLDCSKEQITLLNEPKKGSIKW